MKKALCISTLLVFIAAAAGFPASSNTIRGTIISVSDSSIEIKKGGEEFELCWADDSKVLFKGRESDRSAVRICQKAVVTYAAKDCRHTIVSITILAPGYCTK